MTFTFQASPHFVIAGAETEPGEWSEDTMKELAVLRATYPELAHWGDLALGSAWGSFSEDVMMISWVYWKLDERNEDFLNYCCWLQTHGEWSWSDDAAKLAQADEWKH